MSRQECHVCGIVDDSKKLHYVDTCRACSNSVCSLHQHAHSCGNYRLIGPEEQGLLNAIIESPDDDSPRLVYCDWLLEHEEYERAEYIREDVVNPKSIKSIELELRQSNLGNLAEYQIWARPWMSLNWKQWANANPISHPYTCWETERGFIESLSCGLADWMLRGESLVQRQPIRTVNIVDRVPWGSRNARRAWFCGGMQGPAVIPREIAAFLKNFDRYSGVGQAAYSGEQEARDDLGQACIAWAKTQPARRKEDPKTYADPVHAIY